MQVFERVEIWTCQPYVLIMVAVPLSYSVCNLIYSQIYFISYDRSNINYHLDYNSGLLIDLETLCPKTHKFAEIMWSPCHLKEYCRKSIMVVQSVGLMIFISMDTFSLSQWNVYGVDIYIQGLNFTPISLILEVITELIT